MRGALIVVMMVAFAHVGPAQDLLEKQRREEARRHYRSGHEFMLRESFEEAAREFRTATGLDPAFVLAYYSLGQALMTLKRYPAALEAYTACRDAILRQSALDQRGRSELDRRRRDEIRELEDSLQRLRAGKIKGVSGDMNAQVIAVEQRLRVLRDADMRGAEQAQRVPAELSLGLGSAHFRLGRLEEAEREYRASIGTDAKLGAAHNNLAVICMMTGRLGEAEEEMKRAEKAGFPVNPLFKKDLEEKLRARTK